MNTMILVSEVLSGDGRVWVNVSSEEHTASVSIEGKLTTNDLRTIISACQTALTKVYGN